MNNYRLFVSGELAKSIVILHTWHVSVHQQHVHVRRHPDGAEITLKTDSETFGLFNKLTRFLKPFFNTYTDTPAINLKSHLTATLHQAHSRVLLSTTRDIFQAEKWTGEGQEAAWDASVLEFISLYTLSPLSFSLYNLPSICLELHVTSNKAI